MSVKNKSFLVSDNDVFLDVNLTVSESKRLIAKGIINMPLVKINYKRYDYNNKRFY